ncbi:MAG: hypothetical protein H6839_17365 [Planctomycetes bacterium]|nr:hypothetical protein [Planctomycetota bacterium]
MRNLSAFVFACALLLAACGGGNNATGNSSGGDSNKSCSGNACGGDDKPAAPTAEQKRQAVVDKMKTAIVNLDGQAVLPLFPADEKDLVQKRIVTEMNGMKDEGMKITIKSAKIEEVEGKFFVTFEQTLEANGTTEDDKKMLRLLEVDGEWFLSFKK